MSTDTSVMSFKAGSKIIIKAVKGVDSQYNFYYKEPSGSRFAWGAHDIVVEGRYSTLSGEPDFIFPVNVITQWDEDLTYLSWIQFDGMGTGNSNSGWEGIVSTASSDYAVIQLSAANISDSIRESTIHFKVIARNKTTQLKRSIGHGEIWLLR